MPVSRHFSPLLTVCLCAVVGGCNAAATAKHRPLGFAERVATAHGVDDVDRRQALQGELLIRMTDDEGEGVIDLRFTCELGGSRARVLVGDGTPEGETTLLVYDGRRAWVSPPTAGTNGVRQALVTWPFFLTLPFRVGTSGGGVEELGQRVLAGAPHDAARVTFPAGEDGPVPWCIVYVDPETGLIRAVVYPSPEDGREPRAISFYQFDSIGGLRLPTEWRLWKWHEEEGLYDRPVAAGRVFNLQLIPLRPRLFERPDNAGELIIR